MNATPRETLGGSLVVVVVLIIAASGIFGGSDKPESKPKPVAVKTESKTTTAPHSEPSETERMARKIAREFRSDFAGIAKAREIKSFDRDLDAWDGSLAVTLKRPASMYYDAEAHDFGAMVLATGFPLGLCKVDVRGSDGIRIVEHESQGRGCLNH